MVELKPEWLDEDGRLSLKDDWMAKMATCAGYIRVDDMRISTKGAEEQIDVDDAYENFYNPVFPAVYRIQDLEWFAPVDDEPHAILLIATPRGYEPEDSVIFRMDKHGSVCAHAQHIAVTDQMMAFARKILPTLPAKIKKKWDEREKLIAEGKHCPLTIRRKPAVAKEQ